MIVDAKTVLITLLIVGVVGYFGLQLVRRFALSIALENHESNTAHDVADENRRRRREAEADAAAASAFAKVQPLLPSKDNTNAVPSSSTSRVTTTAVSAGATNAKTLHAKEKKTGTLSNDIL